MDFKEMVNTLSQTQVARRKSWEEGLSISISETRFVFNDPDVNYELLLKDYNAEDWEILEKNKKESEFERLFGVGSFFPDALYLASDTSEIITLLIGHQKQAWNEAINCVINRIRKDPAKYWESIFIIDCCESLKEEE
jgi:hypothetical protein